MDNLQSAMRSYAAGNVGLDALRYAVEQAPPGELTGPMFDLLNEYENTGLGESELRHRVAELLP